MSEPADSERNYVSRAGAKLEHALRAFGVDARGLRCADLGCNVGGFTDCLLQHGAAHVTAVDTAYGVLDWRLRNDPRVVAGWTAGSMIARGWFCALAIFGVGIAEGDEAGLAAAVLVIGLFTVYFAVRMILRPIEAAR